MRLCSVVATPSSLCSQPSSALVRSRGSEPTARCCLPPLTPALPSRPALSAAEQPSECSLRRRLRLPPEMPLLRGRLRPAAEQSRRVSGARVVAFTATARPQRFFRTLRPPADEQSSSVLRSTHPQHTSSATREHAHSRRTSTCNCSTLSSPHDPTATQDELDAGAASQAFPRMPPVRHARAARPRARAGHRPGAAAARGGNRGGPARHHREGRRAVGRGGAARHRGAAAAARVDRRRGRGDRRHDRRRRGGPRPTFGEWPLRGLAATLPFRFAVFFVSHRLWPRSSFPPAASQE
mmetsp:Transcript_25885/g.84669  ORF Transcript_25885/g.84669 Transcript_25885/m.84669 type:complete len:295 (+) Transcript_25885:301-1185(+)